MKKKHRKLKVFLGALAAVVVIVAGYLGISSWVSSLPKLNYDNNTDTSAAVAYPDADFAVISDLHLYDPSLGTTGSQFEETMNSDRKLLLDSEDLLDYAIGDIIKSQVRFVLVSGDMTKDGELVDHNIVAGKLKALTDAGIKVYVIPGNHDINNPGAVSYNGDTTTPVDSITADDFARIYADFGFNDALERDTDSLSYVAEPVDGLWLLAIDDCRYRDNKPGQEETVGGKISQQTADWIAGVLKEASRQGKAVMVMIHHGVVEHWDGQHKLHPDYLIEDYTHFGEFLASYNVRIAFTGHYHAQDITEGTFGDGKYLYDVETGSLITAPCPIRYCSITDNSFTVKSETIVDKLHPGTDFAANATAFVKKTVMLEAEKTLKKYFVSDQDTAYIAEAVGNAFVAHYSGDENPADRPAFDESKLSLWGRFIYSMEGYVINGLWNDLYPPDNNATFSLDG
ncbi:MAG: metallophosphoesterase [Eggerthellaceae bacterium]|nr:metallophosphoesterase [Eggerthellaceae bacterium]